MYYKETDAERLFRQSGPFIHLHTTPLECDVLFRDDNERALAVNYIAIAVYLSECKLLALSIMDNHLHFILLATEEQASLFWEIIRNYLEMYYQRHGRAGLLNGVRAGLTSIDNVAQLRTEIAYVIRNAFVVKPHVHVFADPWSSGYLYFNPLLNREGVPARQLKGRALRDFTCSRKEMDIDPRIYVRDGVAQMWSFVDYHLAECFYDHARQFIHSVLKNVEAQVETARKMGEHPYLDDSELRPIVFALCREKWKAESPAELSDVDKKQLAVLLKSNYSASNKQIARLAKITLSDVNVLFPLAAKPCNPG